MMPTIIEDADLRVNTPSEKHQQTPLDLSGMELAHIEATREKARARWRAANPNPTPRDIARMEALLSDMSSDAKLFAVAVIELGGLESGPVPMPRREAQILLSKSKDGFASAAEKFGEWSHAKVDKGEAGKKHRYSILQNVLDFSEKNRPAPQASSKKPACSSGRFLEDEPACPTGQSPQKRPAGRATSPIGRGDNPDKSQKGGVVFAETATPNEGNGSGRALTPTPTLPSPDPDIIDPDNNPDITAREYIGANTNSSVVINCATIKGPGFVISIEAAEALARMLGMPEGRGKAIAVVEAHSWATQGWTPTLPDRAVAKAIRKHVSQMAEMKSQVAAASEPTQAVKKWSGLLKTADKKVDKDDLETYRHPVTGEVIPMLEYVRIKSEERRNGRRKQQVPEGS